MKTHRKATDNRMYNDFFGLKVSPFELSPDPFFMVSSAISNKAFSSISQGVDRRKGFVVMTGEVGTGKTLLLRCLFEQWERMQIPYAYFIGPRLSTIDFLNYITFELGINVAHPTKGNLLRGLYGFFLAQFAKGLTTVLVIDEAHQIPRSVLEEIRLLTNFETAEQKLVQIVLVGQPELDAKLDSPELRALKQRIAVRCELQPLAPGEIGNYIERRLKLAGAQFHVSALFPAPAVQAIYRYSHGIPRLINSMCDQALLAAYAQQVRTVTVAMIEEIAVIFRLGANGVGVPPHQPSPYTLLAQTILDASGKTAPFAGSVAGSDDPGASLSDPSEASSALAETIASPTASDLSGFMRCEVAIIANIHPRDTATPQPAQADVVVENTRTVVVHDMGAVLRMSTGVTIGQMIVLANARGNELYTRVLEPNENGNVEVEFTQPAAADFWDTGENGMGLGVVLPVIAGDERFPSERLPPAYGNGAQTAGLGPEIAAPVVAADASVVVRAETPKAWEPRPIPVHVGETDRDAAQLNSRRRKLLVLIPVAVFVVGLVAANLYRNHADHRAASVPARPETQRPSPVEPAPPVGPGLTYGTAQNEPMPRPESAVAEQRSMPLQDLAVHGAENSTAAGRAALASRPIPPRDMPAAEKAKPGSATPAEVSMEMPAASSAVRTVGRSLEPMEALPQIQSTGLPLVAAAIAAPIRPGVLSSPNFILNRAIRGHSSWVTGVAFSSDGRRFASSSWDQSVKLWDLQSGKELSAFGNKKKEIQALTFSRDGHWLAAENLDDAVTVWDANSGQEMRSFPTDKSLGPLGRNWVYSIAFSPDGRLLASGIDEKTVRLWEVATGRAIRDLVAVRRRVIYAAFSPDGRRLASGDDDNNILIWDVATGQKLSRLSGHKKTVYAAAFSPDGHSLASASADKTVKIWDSGDGRELRTLIGHDGLVSSLCFSADGHWLASGSWDKTIKIWNVETGALIQTLPAQDRPVYTVNFDSTGQWLASGDENGTIKLWRLSSALDRDGSP